MTAEKLNNMRSLIIAVPLREFFDHCVVYVCECGIDDIAEIDTFEDLRAISLSCLSYQRCL